MAFNLTAPLRLTRFSALLTRVTLIRMRCSLPGSCCLVLRAEFPRRGLTTAEGESALGAHVLRMQGEQGGGALGRGLMVCPQAEGSCSVGESSRGSSGIGWRAPPQSSAETTLNWRFDCADSRWVNWTVAKWHFKPSVCGGGDGWNQLSWAVADLQRALNPLSSKRKQLSESLTPLKSYDSMTSLSSQMRRLTDVLCFSESLPTQPPTFPPTIPPAKEGKKTWCNHDVILGFGFLLDLFVSSFKNQDINKR